LHLSLNTFYFWAFHLSLNTFYFLGISPLFKYILFFGHFTSL
jgi:hypothetical protein